MATHSNKTFELESNNVNLEQPSTPAANTVGRDYARNIASVQHNQPRGATTVVDAPAKKAGDSGTNKYYAATKDTLQALRTSAQKNPNIIRTLIWICSLCLLIFSAMGVVLVFQAIYAPGMFLLNLFNFGFGVALIVMELDAETFPIATEWLFTNFGILKRVHGRVLFMIYVGCMLWAVSGYVVYSSFWYLAYRILAVVFAAVGFQVLLSYHCGMCNCFGAEDYYKQELLDEEVEKEIQRRGLVAERV